MSSPGDPRPRTGSACLSLATVVLLATLVAPSGCVRTTIRSGRAPGTTASAWQDRWHHGFLFGLNEPYGPVVPDRICPNGWSEVDTAIDPMQAAIALLTLGIYTPSTVSVVCADAEPTVPSR